MLKRLKLTAGKMLSQKAVSDRVKRTDVAQAAAIARFGEEVKYYKRQAAPRTSVS